MGSSGRRRGSASLLSTFLLTSRRSVQSLVRSLRDSASVGWLFLGRRSFPPGNRFPVHHVLSLPFSILRHEW